LGDSAIAATVGSVPQVVALLLDRAARAPDRIAYEFLDSDDTVRALTYRDLAGRALAFAQAVEAIAPGAGTGPALLLYPPGLDYVVALFGSFLRGLAVVPAYPPRPTAPDAERERLRGIERDSRAAIVIAPPRAGFETSAPIVSVSPNAISTSESVVRLPDDDVALIQYTSGSTGDPKGVIVRHRSIAANLAGIVERFGIDETARGFSWLPPYHDMGLIGAILTPVLVGAPTRLMSPADFLRQPLRWLRQVSATRATISGGPNFAYELCLRRRMSEEQLKTLDLSSWRVAYNGAEPIRSQTMRDFAERFRVAGFKASAFLPCYGLAEATLLVAARHWDGRGSGSQNEPVSCGVPIEGQRVRIVDPETGRALPEGSEGEIWIAGEHVTSGYWSGDDADRFGTLDGIRYLRTGDLGCLENGELYVSGRLKDVIVFRGANHHAVDVEGAVVEAFQPAHATAVAGMVEGTPEPLIALVIEVRGGPAPEDSLRRVRRSVLERCGLPVDVIALVPPRTIPRTTSGKVQRRACMDWLRRGELDAHIIAGADRLDTARAALNRGEAEVELVLAGMIAGIIAEVCQVETCDLDDNLLELGVDSVRAGEAAAVLEESLDLPVPLDAVLAEPTPRRIAAVLLERWKGGGTDPVQVQERIDGAKRLTLCEATG